MYLSWLINTYSKSIIYFYYFSGGEELCTLDKPNQDPTSQTVLQGYPGEEEHPPSRPESGEESDIEILETRVNQPQNKVRSKRSRMFREKLKEMEKKEEKRTRREMKAKERQQRRLERESQGNEKNIFINWQFLRNPDF